MKSLIVTLRVLGYGCFAVALLMILTGTIGVWIHDGFWEAMWLFSPFNIWNLLTMILTLAPGLALLEVASRLSDRATRKNGSLPKDDG